MLLVMLYAVVNILFSAFAGKRRWKLQAVFSGLLVAIVAVSYIQAKLTRKATFADRAVIHKTFRRAEKRVVFTPIRSLWQMNCVMNC